MIVLIRLAFFFLAIFERHMVVFAEAVLLKEREDFFNDVYVDLSVHQLLVNHGLIFFLVHFLPLLYVVERFSQDVVLVFNLSLFQLFLDSLLRIILEMLYPNIFVNEVIQNSINRRSRHLHLLLL